MTHAPRQTVILFGAHRWSSERYIGDAEAVGLRVVLAVASRDNEGVSPSLRQRVHAVIRMPPEDEPERLARLVGELNDDYGPGWLVLSLDDYVGEEAVRLSEAGGSRYLSRAAEEDTRCKHLMRARWNRFCARNPDLRLCPVPYSFRAFTDFGGARRLRERDESPEFAECAGPFIVKPDEMAGSIEVRRAESADSLDSTVGEVLDGLRGKWLAAAGHHGVRVRPRVQVEWEIPRSAGLPGHPHAEFSAEFLSEGGRHHLLGVTQKWVSESFLEVGHVFPAESLPPSLLHDLRGAVEGLLAELGVWYGVSHWEFIVTPDERLALVETQMRPAGDRIMQLVEFATGAHPIRALLAWMAGKGFDPLLFRPSRSAAICFLAPERPVGRVRDVQADPGIESLCREWWVDLEALADTDWHGPTGWADRYAWVVSTGPDIHEARGRCREAAAHLRMIGERGETRLAVP